jgi:DNA-binding NtrC family response regulator
VLCRDTVPPPFLFITGQGDIAQAVRLIKAGASDYMIKPFEMNVFLKRLAQLLKPVAGAVAPDEFGVSGPAKRIAALVAKHAATSHPVLIRGAEGTGKGHVALMLHHASGRLPSSFVHLNFHRDAEESARALQQTLDDESIVDGTLFINGPARMPRQAQDLLFARLDATLPLQIVAACHTEFERDIANGLFRSDLFYRLKFAEIAIPPFRERPEDAVWLLNRLFKVLNAKREQPVKGLSSLAEEAVRSHDWPGNGRELRSRLQRALETAEGDMLFPADLFPERTISEARIQPLSIVRDAAERSQIIAALERCEGHVGEAAKLLGVSRTTLWEKMQKLRL